MFSRTGGLVGCSLGHMLGHRKLQKYLDFCLSSAAAECHWKLHFPGSFDLQFPVDLSSGRCWRDMLVGPGHFSPSLFLGFLQPRWCSGLVSSDGPSLGGLSSTYTGHSSPSSSLDDSYPLLPFVPVALREVAPSCRCLSLGYSSPLFCVSTLSTSVYMCISIKFLPYEIPRAVFLLFNWTVLIP